MIWSASSAPSAPRPANLGRDPDPPPRREPGPLRGFGPLPRCVGPTPPSDRGRCNRAGQPAALLANLPPCRAR